MDIPGQFKTSERGFTEHLKGAGWLRQQSVGASRPIESWLTRLRIQPSDKGLCGLLGGYLIELLRV